MGTECWTYTYVTYIFIKQDQQHIIGTLHSIADKIPVYYILRFLARTSHPSCSTSLGIYYHRLLLRLSTKHLGNTVTDAMPENYGCLKKNTSRVLALAKKLDLNVIGVR